MHTNEHLVEQVNEIIQINIDRREGYEKAIDQVNDTQLKTLFEDCCRQSDEYINELRQVVIRHGGTPADTTSTAGDLFRIWMDIKAALSMSNTKAALQSCERGEDAALNAYNRVLETKALPIDNTAYDLLKKQESGILIMHDRVKALRDTQQ